MVLSALRASPIIDCRRIALQSRGEGKARVGDRGRVVPVGSNLPIEPDVPTTRLARALSALVVASKGPLPRRKHLPDAMPRCRQVRDSPRLAGETQRGSCLAGALRSAVVRRRLLRFEGAGRCRVIRPRSGHAAGGVPHAGARAASPTHESARGRPGSHESGRACVLGHPGRSPSGQYPDAVSGFSTG